MTAEARWARAYRQAHSGLQARETRIPSCEAGPGAQVERGCIAGCVQMVRREEDRRLRERRAAGGDAFQVLQVQSTCRATSPDCRPHLLDGKQAGQLLLPLHDPVPAMGVVAPGDRITAAQKRAPHTTIPAMEDSLAFSAQQFTTCLGHHGSNPSRQWRSAPRCSFLHGARQP